MQHQQQGHAAAARGTVGGMEHIFPGGVNFVAEAPAQSAAPGTPAAVFPFMTPKQPPRPSKWEAVIRKVWQLSSDPKTYMQPSISGTTPGWLTFSTATSVELVTEPAAVAYLLTNEMGLAHVSWKQRECPSLGTVIVYSLRLQ